MRSPEEFLELQYRHAARTAKALENVDDDRLIKMNSTHYLDKTLMAFLVAQRFSLAFDTGALIKAVGTVESNLAVLLKFSDTNYTTYLLACMLAEQDPKSEILRACVNQASNADFLVSSSVVPYLFYGVISEQAASKMASLKDNRKAIAIESSMLYLELLAPDFRISEHTHKKVEGLFRKRKSNGFYSESRLYGGGPDNDYVCDLEYAAISKVKTGVVRAIPSS